MKNVAETVSALESSRIVPGSDKCLIDTAVLARYIPKEEPNLLPATVQMQDKFETGEREAIIRTLFQLKQDVDYLKEIVAKAGLGRGTSQAIAPPQREDVEDWQTSGAVYDDPEEQDPEEQEVITEKEEVSSIKEASLDLIERVLRKHGGNRKAAAAELGISERTLYRKIKQIK